MGQNVPVEGLTTNILPTNEATLPTSATSNHGIFAPRKLPAIQIVIIERLNFRCFGGFLTQKVSLCEGVACAC